MLCSKCGADIPDQAEFCTNCGNPVVKTEANIETISGAEPLPATHKKPKHLKAVIISAASVLAAAGCVVLALVLIHNANVARYNGALAVMSTDPAHAKAEFTALGGFEDSTAEAKTCQNMLDYTDAKNKMDAENYPDAEASFESLGSYAESASLAAQCKAHIDYNNAAALKKAGKTGDALTAFKALGSFLDSAAQATDCQNIIDYAAAKALYDSGDYLKARDAFADLVDYGDSNSMRDLCSYEIADGYYKEGKYFSAYTIFPMLNGVKDSAELAMSCVRNDYTKTGELYRNPDYKSGKVPITFKTPDDKNVSYIKIYKGDTLVSTVYIASGKKVKIKLPAGTYSFNAAYGVQWFGETEMFGDMGYYCQVVFDKSGGTTWKLKTHWIYTLTLRMSKGGYMGNVIGPSGF